MGTEPERCCSNIVLSSASCSPLPEVYHYVGRSAEKNGRNSQRAGNSNRGHENLG